MAQSSAEEAERHFEEALGLVDKFFSIEEPDPKHSRESVRLDHSTEDLFYFVLARRTGAALITLDRKLMRLCEEHGVSYVSEIELEREPAKCQTPE